MEQGRYFHIISKLSDLVLDIEDGEAEHGKKILTNGLHGGNSQLWYCDHIFGVIRSKLNDKYVFDLDDDTLVIKEFDDNCPSQQWILHKDQIRNVESAKVIDIMGESEDEGATLCAWEYKDQNNQRWIFNYPEPCYLMIRSKMHGKVLDVEGEGDSGADVIMGEEHGGDNQLWYEDRHGLIYHKISDLVLDSGDDDDKFEMKKYCGTRKVRQWIRAGDRIINAFKPSQCMDIDGGDDSDGAKLVDRKYVSGDNQRWKVVYVNTD